MLLNSYVKKLGVKQTTNFIDYTETKQTDTFLLNLYAFIFVHYSKSVNTVKYLESRTASRTSGALNNNFYFIYNSVYFSTSRVRRSKFSLSEFLSTKMDIRRNIVSFHKTKKKIGFGKLTWYWIFKTMSNNRFFLNYKEYRNQLSMRRYNLFEIALKNYEKNYNNWLFWANKTPEFIEMPFLKTKTRKLFRLYRKNYDFEKYRTSIILKMRHRFDVALPTKSYKYYRKMPFIFKRKIRKKKRRTKLKSASKIRYFRKRSKAFEIWEPIKQKKFLPLIFKKNISVYKYAKYWERLSDRSAWKLRQAKNSYYAEASLTFIRSNFSTPVYERHGPSLIKMFTGNVDKEKKNLINFKYKFPKNLAELSYSYDYFTTFTNTNPVVRSKKNDKHLISKTTRDFFFKKNLVKYYSPKSINMLKMFKSSPTEDHVLSLKKNNNKFIFNKKINKKKYENNKKSKVLEQKKILQESIRSAFKPKSSPNKNYVAKSYNVYDSAYLLPKKKYNVANKLKLMFYYKSSRLVSNLLKEWSVSYTSTRFLINKVRLDQVIANIFITNMLTKEVFKTSNMLLRRRVGKVWYSASAYLYGLAKKNFVNIGNGDEGKFFNSSRYEKFKVAKKLKNSEKKTLTNFNTICPILDLSINHSDNYLSILPTFDFEKLLGFRTKNETELGKASGQYSDKKFVKEKKLKWGFKLLRKSNRVFGLISKNQQMFVDSEKLTIYAKNYIKYSVNGIAAASLFKKKYKLKAISKTKLPFLKKKYKGIKKKYKFLLSRLASKRTKRNFILSAKRFKNSASLRFGGGNWFLMLGKKKKLIKRYIFFIKSYKSLTKRIGTANTKNTKNFKANYGFYKTISPYSIFFKKYSWVVPKKNSTDISYTPKLSSIKNSMRGFRYNRLRFRVYLSPSRLITFRFKKLKKKIALKKNYKKNTIGNAEQLSHLNFFSYNFFNKKLKQKKTTNIKYLMGLGFYNNDSNLFNLNNINLSIMGKFVLGSNSLLNLKNKKKEMVHLKKSLIQNSVILGFKSKFYFNFNDSCAKFFKNLNSLERSFKPYDRPKNYHEFLMEHYYKKNKIKKTIEKAPERKVNYQWLTFYCRFDVYHLFGVRAKRLRRNHLDNCMRSSLATSYFYNNFLPGKTTKFSIIRLNSELGSMKDWPLPLKYNFYRHSLNRYAAAYRGAKVAKKKNKWKIKNFIRFIKKTFKWKKLIVQKFRKLGWGWKRNFNRKKSKLLSIRRDLYKRSSVSSLKNFPRVITDFVGIKLINKLKKVSVKKSMLFWTKNRFCLWRSKPFHLTGYFWSKFQVNLTRLHRDHSYMYRIPRTENKHFFYKRELFLWKFKNLFVLRKYKQFADRFYPKKWYKVKRKKFPLKRHLKDWSLKLSKMHIFKYNGVTFPALYTFYDSSSVYYKNISSVGKPKRYKNIHRIKNVYKQQDIDRDLEIFCDDIKNPPFAKFAGKKQYFYSWKAKQAFKSLGKDVILGNSAPSLYTRAIPGIKVNRLKLFEVALYRQYSKKQSLFLKKRLDSFTVHLGLIFSKVKTHILKNEPGFVLKTIYETKAPSDAFGSRINFYENSYNKYNVMLKNFLYSKRIANLSLVKSFALTAANSYKLLHYTYKASGRYSSVIKYYKYNAEQLHKDTMLFIYTSRYRHPTYQIRHSHFKHSNFYKEINNLSGFNRIKLLNGRLFKNNSITRETFSEVDFLKNRKSAYQFRHKVSNFYKKNIWIFNGFDGASTSYSVKTLI